MAGLAWTPLLDTCEDECDDEIDAEDLRDGEPKVVYTN